MLRAELAAAFIQLTRLPAGWLLRGKALPDPARCVWAYPLVGLAVGGIGAGGYLLCYGIGMPTTVGAIWTLAAMMLATGALHEDGLADTADGFGGGRTPERKLAIMRDSQIGSYGALALTVSLALRGTCIASLAYPGRVAPALVAGSAMARGSIGVLLLVLSPARQDGLATTLRERDPVQAALGPALATIAAFVLLPAGLACGAVIVSGMAALALAGLARRQVGGYTGDVLGAGVVAVECAVLTLITSAWKQ